MVEDQRADAGFRVHHEAFRKLHADFFRLEQFPNASLIFQVGASRIAETVTLAPIARSEPRRHGHLRRIRKAPVFTNAAVQPFGTAFRGFDGERLQAVA